MRTWLWFRWRQTHRIEEGIFFEGIMKVAIAKEGDRVSEHFGHCTEYALFVIEKSEITSREILESPGHERESCRHSLHRTRSRTSSQAAWAHGQWTCSAKTISRFSLECGARSRPLSRTSWQERLHRVRAAVPTAPITNAVGTNTIVSCALSRRDGDHYPFFGNAGSNIQKLCGVPL